MAIILSDAITQAVMQADAVDVGRLEAMLRDVARVWRHAERDRVTPPRVCTK
jgi:hypothetical protein